MTDELIQGTDEWKAIRLGKATGSRISDIMAKGRAGAPSASRANYAAQLIAERLTGKCEESYTNDAMRWGTDHEDDARNAYAFIQGVTIEQVGFIAHPTIEMAGCSPDGLVNGNGMVEIKCPNSATHIATLLDLKIPDKYFKQMQWQMACSGRSWCDFSSYDPRLPESMQSLITRVHRDNVAIDEMESEVRRFLGEIDSTVSALQAKYG